MQFSPLRRAWFLAAAMTIAWSGRSICAQTNEPALTPAKRIELFDGKSLAGWKIVVKSPPTNSEPEWSVKDGVIACTGKPNGYARTEQCYQNYKLHAEWRWPSGAGNSGVFVHLTGEDKVWPLCLEAQLLAGDAGTIRMNGGARVHELATPDAKNVTRRTPGTEKPPGEWNTYDITCRGKTVATRVNGVPQSEATESSIDSGAIALQAEGKPVEFRNIYLEPLPAAGTAP